MSAAASDPGDSAARDLGGRVWLVGASGIGKTFHGQRIAQELQLPFLQLDAFRDSAWQTICNTSHFRNSRFGTCSTYVEARTHSLESLQSYCSLHAWIGRQMLRALRRAPQWRDSRPLIVECSAVYLPLLPRAGWRLHVHVSPAQHLKLIQQAVSLDTNHALILHSFLCAVEAQSLALCRVDSHCPLSELRPHLQRRFARRQPGLEPSCSIL